MDWPWETNGFGWSIVMGEDWYQFALDEIKPRVKRLTQWEKDFILSMEKKILAGLFLSEEQERKFLEIHRKATDISRIVK